jgi:hypothetical protein
MLLFWSFDEDEGPGLCQIIAGPWHQRSAVLSVVSSDAKQQMELSLREP